MTAAVVIAEPQTTVNVLEEGAAVVTERVIVQTVTVGVEGPQGPPGTGVMGPQGPPGPAGGSRHTHVQSTPSATWTVAHNLGAKPLVTVLSPGGVEVIAQVLHLSVNVTQIFFDSPATGSAIFI